MWATVGTQDAQNQLFPEADASMESLVAQVKACQKDPEAKEQWIMYVNAEGQGTRDPARHSPEFLQSFLSHLSSGGRFAPSGDSDAADLAEAIKKGQRQSV